jgi:hypothetical protein
MLVPIVLVAVGVVVVVVVVVATGAYTTTPEALISCSPHIS